MDPTTKGSKNKMVSIGATSSPAPPSTEGAGPSKDVDIDDISEIDITLLTLRKTTDLKKVIDSVPKPIRAVPKNGLPKWYKLGMECKLPVPKMPAGRIVFSRGKIGEDVRRVGLGSDCPRPTFDLTDPYCYNVTYDYVAVHDPHLAHHFQQKPARNRMKHLGLCTKDNRAVCSLREFNLYRKYLYNRFMDRIHMEMKKLDERARDDLTLKKVEADVARRATVFARSERAREQMEKHARLVGDEAAEKKRRAKEQEKKVQARMNYLAEFKAKQRKERHARAYEKENRIKQRVQAAAEMELRRKITMVRQWRLNEKRRLNRLAAEREEKQKQLEEDANLKWEQRVEAQNQKIQEESLLLRLYTEDMAAGSARRMKKADIYAYNNNLRMQRIRLTTWKLMHGGAQKAVALVRKMGDEFEKSKRGAKGMSPELAQEMAQEAMATAMSTQGDPLMTLGQARARMDIETVLPPAPIRILEQILETAVVEFARRRVHNLLRDVEQLVHSRALTTYYQHVSKHPSSSIRRSKQNRFAAQLAAELTRQFNVQRHQLAFGETENIPPESDNEIEFDLKSVKDRPPTPVPSMTKLAEVTFTDRVDDLPDPVTVATYLPERKKLLEMVNTAAKILTRTTNHKVEKGLDLIIGSVTLPRLKHKMEWGEAVESLSDAVVNNRISVDCADVRHCCEFLTYRILVMLKQEMKLDKESRKKSIVSGASYSEDPSTQKDFYVPAEEPSAKPK